jgi:hypothetical protein
MTRFAIRFVLDDLAHVEPWGDGENAQLHWFGLSQGCYWIETPEGDIFRYSPAAPSDQDVPGAAAHYYVARMFEDLQEVMPAALEPVPLDIAERFTSRDWHERLDRWTDETAATEEPGSTALWDLSQEALAWWGARTIYTGYLRCGPLITIWRTEEKVHLRWTSRSNEIDGISVFALPTGDITLPAETFDCAAEEFLDAVLAAMSERVCQVVRGATTRRPYRIDLAGLAAEQRRRADERRSSAIPARTNWEQVREKLEALAREVGKA